MDYKRTPKYIIDKFSLREKLVDRSYAEKWCNENINNSEVVSFLHKAYAAYRRAGFIEEGRRREAEFIDGQYCDVIIMGILHYEYNDN